MNNSAQSQDSIENAPAASATVVHGIHCVIAGAAGMLLLVPQNSLAMLHCSSAVHLHHPGTKSLCPNLCLCQNKTGSSVR